MDFSLNPTEGRDCIAFNFNNEEIRNALFSLADYENVLELGDILLNTPAVENEAASPEWMKKIYRFQNLEAFSHFKKVIFFSKG